jgi:hypothetical protein
MGNWYGLGKKKNYLATTLIDFIYLFIFILPSIKVTVEPYTVHFPKHALNQLGVGKAQIFVVFI